MNQRLNFPYKTGVNLHFWKLVFLCLPISIGAFGQTDSLRLNIDEIAIEGNRTKKDRSQNNQNTYILTKEEIQSLPARSLQEVLQFVSGVDVRQRGVGGVQADISILGGSFEQTLFLLNGVKLSDPQTGHHAMNIPIPLEAIERIEIIKGPATRSFGQNAFSGAINIVTKLGQERQLTISTFAGDFSTFGSSLFLSLPIKKIRQTISGSMDISKGYRFNSDYQVGNLQYEAAWKPGKLHEWKALVAYSTRDFGANGFYTDKFPEQWEATQTLLGALSHTFSKKQFTLQTRGYYRSNQDEFRLKKSVPSFYTNLHKTAVYAGEINGNFTTTKGVIGFGSEVRQEDIESSNLGNRNRTFYGLYVEYTKSFFKKLDVNIGIHSTYYSFYQWKHFPGIDLGYKLSKHHRFFTNYGLSYRIPTYTELFYTDLSTSSNPDLLPEQAKTLQAGWVFVKNKSRLSASYFHRNSENLIDYVRETPVSKWVPVNLGQVLFDGVEISGEQGLNFQAFHVRLTSVSLGYTFISANVIQQEGIESRYALNALRHQLVGGLRFEIMEKLTLSTKVRFLERMTAGSYGLLDLKMETTSNKDTRFFLELTNVTNTDYIESGWVQMPGRWIKIGVTVKVKK